MKTETGTMRKFWFRFGASKQLGDLRLYYHITSYLQCQGRQGLGRCTQIDSRLLVRTTRNNISTSCVIDECRSYAASGTVSLHKYVVYLFFNFWYHQYLHFVILYLKKDIMQNLNVRTQRRTKVYTVFKVPYSSIQSITCASYRRRNMCNQAIYWSFRELN